MPIILDISQTLNTVLAWQGVSLHSAHLFLMSEYLHSEGTALLNTRAVSLRAAQTRIHFKCKGALNPQHLDDFPAQTHLSAALSVGPGTPALPPPRPRLRDRRYQGSALPGGSRTCLIPLATRLLSEPEHVAWRLFRLYAFVPAGRINKN